ncbi:MAG: hypothetical protein QM479_17255 [Pseudomonadota bacterium]
MDTFDFDGAVKQVTDSNLSPKQKADIIKNTRLYQKLENGVISTSELIILHERLNCNEKSIG